MTTQENYIAGADFKTASPSTVYQLTQEWLDNTSYRIEHAKDEKDLLYTLMDTHIEFERIHLFDDGNGRTGRELINFELAKHDLPFLVIGVKDRPFYLQNLEDKNVDALVSYAQTRMSEENTFSVDKTLNKIQKQKLKQQYKNQLGQQGLDR